MKIDANPYNNDAKIDEQLMEKMIVYEKAECILRKENQWFLMIFGFARFEKRSKQLSNNL